MGDYRNKSGHKFWSDEASNAPAKIVVGFAIDKIEDHYDRLDFLVGWNEGDLTDFPEFFDYLDQQPK